MISQESTISRSTILAAAAAFIVAAAGGYAAWQSSRAVRIGVVLPFTGPEAEIGLGMRNAIRLAAEEVNARGGIQGRKVKLVELDEGGRADLAAAASRRLVEDQKVLAVIGGCDHDGYESARQILGTPRVPFVTGAVTDRELSSVGLGTHPAEFSLLPFGTTEMAKAAEYATAVLGARTFAFVRDDNTAALWDSTQFRVEAWRALKTVFSAEEILHSDAEIPPLVERLRGAPPQMISYTGSVERTAALLKQLRAAGIKSTFLAGLHEPSGKLVELAGDAAEGALAVLPLAPAGDTAAGREFLERYAARRYPEPASWFGIAGYAEAQIVLAALDRSFLTRPSVAGALKNEQFDTALGPVRFNYVGSSVQTAFIYQVVKGKWTPTFAAGPKALTPYVAH